MTTTPAPIAAGDNLELEAIELLRWLSDRYTALTITGIVDVLLGTPGAGEIVEPLSEWAASLVQIALERLGEDVTRQTVGELYAAAVAKGTEAEAAKFGPGNG